MLSRFRLPGAHLNLPTGKPHSLLLLALTLVQPRRFGPHTPALSSSSRSFLSFDILCESHTLLFPLVWSCTGLDSAHIIDRARSVTAPARPSQSYSICNPGRGGSPLRRCLTRSSLFRSIHRILAFIPCPVPLAKDPVPGTYFMCDPRRQGFPPPFLRLCVAFWESFASRLCR